MDALNKFVGPSGENGRYDRWTAWFWISGDERSDDDYDTVMMTMTTVGNGYVNLMKKEPE